MKYDKYNRRVDRLQEKFRLEQERCDSEKAEKNRVMSILDSTMHEVRSLTSQLTTQAADLAKKLYGGEFESQVTTIHHISEMVTARLAYTDLQLNPVAISRQTKVPAGFYKKFEKARYVLGQSARAKKIEVIFNGNSYGTIDVLQAFELIPFIVLDNAIKYSKVEDSIIVNFSETQNEICAEVLSIGPMIRSGEEDKLFNKNFRGHYAEKLAVYGAGLGLYIARNIADLHSGVTIKAYGSQKQKFTLNDVPYSDFRVVVSALR